MLQATEAADSQEDALGRYESYLEARVWGGEAQMRVAKSIEAEERASALAEATAKVQTKKAQLAQQQTRVQVTTTQQAAQPAAQPAGSRLAARPPMHPPPPGGVWGI